MLQSRLERIARENHGRFSRAAHVNRPFISIDPYTIPLPIHLEHVKPCLPKGVTYQPEAVVDKPEALIACLSVRADWLDVCRVAYELVIR